MFPTLMPAAAAALCLAAALPQTPVVKPGAPGQPSTTVISAMPMTAPKASAADIAFMQGMIHHHAQALEMTALLYTRSADPAMKLLAKRIDVSQTDEIGMMRRWLLARGAEAPDPLGASAAGHAMPGMDGMDGMDMGGAPTMMMPGMLTAAQMKALAAAKGPAFDKLFLEGMIQHHGGALVMVAELLKAPGAVQDADIGDFASHVDADQRMEIIRMSAMLDTLKGIRR